MAFAHVDAIATATKATGTTPIKNAEDSVGAYSIFITLLWYGKYSLATHGWIQHQFTGPSTILNNALTFHFLDKSDVTSGPSLLFQTLSSNTLQAWKKP